jgi:uncharacterized protein involved in exopolysaccharide biosynthesis
MTEEEIAGLRFIPAELPTARDPIESPGDSHFLDPVVTLLRYKILIFGLPLIIGGLAAIFSLIVPPVYTAEVKIMPPQQGQSMAASILGQLGPLAAAAANSKDLSVHGPSDLYAVMLHSRTIADALIRRFSLMSVYKAKRHVEARMRLDDLTKITISKESVISIAVNDRDPNRAADIANGYVEELLKLTRTLAVTEAGQRRLFFEHEVQLASDQLATAEQALKATQESTGIIQLDSQAKAAIESISNLRAQIATKEAQVQSMRSFATSENPDLIRAQQELAALRVELARLETGGGASSTSDISMRKVPEASLEYVRKLREVKYRETLLDLLTKQYEAARIDEAKDAAIVQVLDKAEPPELRTWPHRTSFVLTAVFLSFIFGPLIVFGWERSKKLEADPRFKSRMKQIKFLLKRKSRVQLVTK